MKNSPGRDTLALLAFFFVMDLSWSLRNETQFQMKPKIIGSSGIANVELFEVSLFNQKYPHYCGGAIITSKWVLTSAHCKGVCENQRLCAVRYGTLELKKGYIAPIRRFIPHEHYSKFPYLQNDIALVECHFDPDVQFNAIGLHSFDIPFKEPLILVGWGWTANRAGSCSKHLRYTRLRRTSCPPGLSQTFFCAFDKESNACHGDSGGSLLYDGELVGLVGFSLTGIEGERRESNELEDALDDNEETYALEARRRRQYKRSLFKERCKIGETVAFTYVARYIPWIDETMRNSEFHNNSMLRSWLKEDYNLITNLKSNRDC